MHGNHMGAIIKRIAVWAPALLHQVHGLRFAGVADLGNLVKMEPTGYGLRVWSLKGAALLTFVYRASGFPRGENRPFLLGLLAKVRVREPVFDRELPGRTREIQSEARASKSSLLHTGTTTQSRVPMPKH